MQDKKSRSMMKNGRSKDPLTQTLKRMGFALKAVRH
jgi:hypothetical protein